MRAPSKIWSLIGATIVTGGLLVLGLHSRDSSTASPIDPLFPRAGVTVGESRAPVASETEQAVSSRYSPLTSDGF